MSGFVRAISGHRPCRAGGVQAVANLRFASGPLSPLSLRQTRELRLGAAVWYLASFERFPATGPAGPVAFKRSRTCGSQADRFHPSLSARQESFASGRRSGIWRRSSDFRPPALQGRWRSVPREPVGSRARALTPLSPPYKESAALLAAFWCLSSSERFRVLPRQRGRSSKRVGRALDPPNTRRENHPPHRVAQSVGWAGRS